MYYIPSGSSVGPVDVYSDEKSVGTDVWKRLLKVSGVPDLCSIEMECDGRLGVAVVPAKQACPILKTDTPCSELYSVHVP